MQKVAQLKNGAEIYIDFAHSPDSLEKTLLNAKKFTQNRLLVLFGCGGDRDNKKRNFILSKLQVLQKMKESQFTNIPIY